MTLTIETVMSKCFDNSRIRGLGPVLRNLGLLIVRNPAII